MEEEIEHLGQQDCDCKQCVNVRALIDLAKTRGLPEPEVCPEPDGYASVDWVFEIRKLVTVTVSDKDQYAIAWLWTGSTGHHVAESREEAISVIIRLLKMKK